MDPSNVEILCKNVRVRNIKAVRSILESYTLHGWIIEAIPDSKGSGGKLKITSEPIIWWQRSTPCAWKTSDVPDFVLDEDDDDDDEYTPKEQWFDDNLKEGIRGVSDLLVALAPYLESPLHMLATFWYVEGGPGCTVRSWAVQPNGKKCDMLDAFKP